MVKHMEKTKQKKNKSLHQPLTEKADSLGAHTDELSAGSSCWIPFHSPDDHTEKAAELNKYNEITGQLKRK